MNLYHIFYILYLVQFILGENMLMILRSQKLTKYYIKRYFKYVTGLTLVFLYYEDASLLTCSLVIYSGNVNKYEISAC